MRVMYICVYVFACVGAHMYSQRSISRIILDGRPHWGGIAQQIQSSVIWLLLLGDSLWDHRIATFCGLWGPTLWFACLHGKCFNHRAAPLSWTSLEGDLSRSLQVDPTLMRRFPLTGLTRRILEQVKIIINMQIGFYASSNIVKNEHALLLCLIILSSFFRFFF